MSLETAIPDQHRLQRRTVSTLATGQILGGLGIGTASSLGALLVTEVTSSPAWSGMAATMITLGAAVFALPLATMARRRGRRVSLTTGAALAAAGACAVVGSAMINNPVLVMVSLLIMGSGTALNLQARFAATDLASTATEGRDLSLVVWSTTIGAVAAPNLAGPGEALGNALGLPAYSGGFIIAAAAQIIGAALYLVALRPDPLLLAMKHEAPVAIDNHDTTRRSNGFGILARNFAALRVVIVIALSHAVMVALMGMTPVHLAGHGASLTIVGLTISLHIAGMYALSPIFGILSDRVNGPAVILIGQLMYVAAALLTAFGGASQVAVTAGLVLLGLGWSASTVAGSTLLSESLPIAQRPQVQGVSDMSMNIVGAAGGAVAGPVMALIGYSGLSIALIGVVVITSAVQLLPTVPRASTRTKKNSAFVSSAQP